MTEITHRNDVLAEAQKVLDQARWLKANMELEGDTTGAKIVDDLITRNRSLLEPLGDEGRELVADLQAKADQLRSADKVRYQTTLPTSPGPSLLIVHAQLMSTAAALIERLAAALSVEREALVECVSVLADPVVGTIYGDDPEWYQKLDVAVAKARALLGDQP